MVCSAGISWGPLFQLADKEETAIVEAVEIKNVLLSAYRYHYLTINPTETLQRWQTQSINLQDLLEVARKSMNFGRDKSWDWQRGRDVAEARCYGSGRGVGANHVAKIPLRHVIAYQASALNFFSTKRDWFLVFS
jgi:hypothetical protein